LQDFSIWEGVEDRIWAMLQPSELASEAAQDRYPDLLALPKKLALHVRRGDFIPSDPIHPPCPLSYYEEAVDFLRRTQPSVDMVVFSDEVEWCRRNLPFDVAMFVDGNPDWLDLALMTKCEHHICSNSTFAWWGAFLSADPQPIVPWIVGVPDTFRARHPSDWHEIEITVVPP
jgi:Glycosyl transferase family 11